MLGAPERAESPEVPLVKSEKAQMTRRCANRSASVHDPDDYRRQAESFP